MYIDVVIPYRYSPRTNDLELKYCLRGIEKHLIDARQVWVIGDCPGYINPYAVVPFIETNWYEHLTRNIHNKIMLACDKPEISDPFLYMNDDHFLLQDVRVLNIPFYHNGIVWKGTGRYITTIANTLNKYPGAFNFDVHAPMLIHKDLYRQAMAVLNWKTPFGFAIKTSYCSHLKIKGEYYPDYKIDRIPLISDFEEIKERKFFSVGDKAMREPMINFLNKLYPNKSIYET